MHDITEIKIMLDAFYQGEASKEQESRLQAYFSQNDLPEEMQWEKDIFNSLFEQDSCPIPQGLESRLSSLIDKLEKEDTKRIAAHNFSKKKKLWLEIGGIAASVCLLISIGLFVMNQGEGKSSNSAQLPSSLSKLSPEDKKKIIEAQKALEMVSTNFNKGLDGMQSVSENF